MVMGAKKKQHLAIVQSSSLVRSSQLKSTRMFFQQQHTIQLTPEEQVALEKRRQIELVEEQLLIVV